MSLIDTKKEKELIKAIADRLYKARENEMKCSETLVQKKEQSNFYKRQDGVVDIFEYKFDTPVELQSLLTHYWDTLQEENMKEFVAVSTVSAFKNRNNSLQGSDVSPYVYEF